MIGRKEEIPGFQEGDEGQVQPSLLVAASALPLGFHPGGKFLLWETKAVRMAACRRNGFGLSGVEEAAPTARCRSVLGGDDAAEAQRGRPAGYGAASMASAIERSLVSGDSARDSRTSGTFAPTTIPQDSPLAK